MKDAVLAFGNPSEDYSINICLANETGQIVKQLTDGNSRDWFPAWSPNGQSIAYSSDKGSTRHFYGLDQTDYSLTALTSPEEAAHINPKRKLHPMPNGTAQVWIMDADGSNQRPLTSEGANAHPAWSPDGDQIAFNSTRTGKLELFLMDADGSNQRQLTHSPDETAGPFERLRHIELLMHSLYSPDVHGPTNIFPTWSPDGTRLAFCSIGQESYAIWVMDMNSRKFTRITYPGDGLHPQANCPFWSPTSDQITYWSGIHVGPGSIWLMNADGSNPRRVSDEPEGAICDEPSWSADGSKILYTTNRQDEREGLKSAVWVTNPDGTSQHPLVKNAIPGFNRASWKRVSASI
ncbi:MAG: hypothetical protein AAF629_29590 [Chloroflexota bacterium]